MVSEEAQTKNSYLQDLGGGLILRQATAEDVESLTAFNAQVHRQEGSNTPEERVGTWTRELMTRPHPTFSAGDFTLVVIEEWKPEPHRHSGEAGFPELTFLQLLFGYRDLSELKYAFAGCRTRGDQAFALLDILFPKKASQVWPVS